MLTLRRRRWARAALIFASLAWLVSAASLVCGRPLLHQAMTKDADCITAMGDGAAPQQDTGGGDCSDRPCLEDGQPYDLVQLAMGDAPLLLALLATAITLVLVWSSRWGCVKPPDPPDIKPIPLFQRYCVLRN